MERSEPYDPRTEGTTATLGLALRKLLAALEEENESLSRADTMQHTELTAMKNQALRDLMILQKTDGFQQALPALGSEIRQVKDLLARNAHLLKTHIDALGTIADIIVTGIREVDSDGTYSRRRPDAGR